MSDIDREDKRIAEDRLFKLIADDIKTIKVDVKTGISNIRKDFSDRREICNEKFVDKVIFWKVVTAFSILLVGSYSVSGYILKIVSALAMIA